MKVHDCIQGTTEWAALRAGIPTSSSFDRILTATGKPSAQAEKYMFQLLAERMMGHPVVEFTSHWMDRGSEMEAEAIRFYQFQREEEVRKVGFITSDDDRVGCSPDMLVGTNGLLEIKCPSEAIQVAYLMQSGKAYDEYRVQTQGQLWISEREWNDLLAFHPELPPALHRIYREDLFIEKLAGAVYRFSDVLESNYLICKANGWVKDPEKPKVDIVQAMKEALIESQR